MTTTKRPACGNDCCACLSDIPNGGHCYDCAHVARCVMIFGQKEGEPSCQFIPSRFSPLASDDPRRARCRCGHPWAESHHATAACLGAVTP